MTKLEYAEKIAKEVNGEAKEVEKNNGVILTGIEVNTGSSMRPMIYIDDMYDQKLEVPEAVKQVRLIVKKCAKDDLDLSFLEVWDDVKPRLKARLCLLTIPYV